MAHHLLETGARAENGIMITPAEDERAKLNRFQASRRSSLKDLSMDTMHSSQAAEVYDTMSETFTDPQGLEDKFHGPAFQAADRTAATKKAFIEMATQATKGLQHKQWMQYQKDGAAMDPAWADNPLGINTVTRRVFSVDGQDPFMAPVVLISDPEDAERIAKGHVKKQPNFTPIFFQSLIATTDNDYWAKQRNHLNPVFLPGASLSKIFPTSLARAKTCAKRMKTLMREQGDNGVQVHEFFLHEAQAQLQMALFGMDEAFMESTNMDVRAMMNGSNDDPDFGTQIAMMMMKKVAENPDFATAQDSQQTGKPVWGPLSKAVVNASTDPELDMDLYDQFGNMMLILFAGHDTTGHTMTWLTYEMARNPGMQAKLHAEIDAMFEEIGDRDMTYRDCQKLPYLSRCVMETLRKWTAVPNGTFRELMYDEQVSGPGGKKVLLKKGTFVQVINWMRQRNPNLWKDPDTFDPDRDWQGNEIWGGRPFAATNPSSPRFSPFTYAPRACLGMNFAQMEMRTIIANVYRDFEFELSPHYKDEALKSSLYPVEMAFGTCGPRDLTPEGLARTRDRIANGQRPAQGMWLKVKPRTKAGTRARL